MPKIKKQKTLKTAKVSKYKNISQQIQIQAEIDHQQAECPNKPINIGQALSLIVQPNYDYFQNIEQNYRGIILLISCMLHGSHCFWQLGSQYTCCACYLISGLFVNYILLFIIFLVRIHCFLQFFIFMPTNQTITSNLIQGLNFVNENIMPPLFWFSNTCFQPCFMPILLFTETTALNIDHFSGSSSPIQNEIPKQIPKQSESRIKIEAAELGQEIHEQKQKKMQQKSEKLAPARKHKLIQLGNILEGEKNRNILSNSLKLALKHIRNLFQSQHIYLRELFKKLNIGIGSMEKFYQRLNILLPIELNYIRPILVKKLLQEEQKQFAIVLKILLRKFFRQTIYTATGKLTQMKKLVRAQHIKAGRRLLRYFFEVQDKNGQYPTDNIEKQQNILF